MVLLLDDFNARVGKIKGIYSIPDKVNLVYGMKIAIELDYNELEGTIIMAD